VRLVRAGCDSTAAHGAPPLISRVLCKRKAPGTGTLTRKTRSPNRNPRRRLTRPCHPRWSRRIAWPRGRTPVGRCVCSKTRRMAATQRAKGLSGPRRLPHVKRPVAPRPFPPFADGAPGPAGAPSSPFADGASVLRGRERGMGSEGGTGGMGSSPGPDGAGSWRGAAGPRTSLSAL
jgi:hypothetical protein